MKGVITNQYCKFHKVCQSDERKNTKQSVKLAGMTAVASDTKTPQCGHLSEPSVQRISYDIVHEILLFLSSEPNRPQARSCKWSTALVSQRIQKMRISAKIQFKMFYSQAIHVL